MDSWQWAVAALAAFMVGLAKTGVAGLGILTVAMFASVFPARESVGIVLLVLIAADLVAVTVYRRAASWPHLVRLFPWAAVGILVGFAALDRLDEVSTRRLLGAILLALTLFRLTRPRTPPADPEERPTASRAMVIGTGLLAGFTTMVANAAGPVMILYLLAMRLPKMAFIGTSAWFFLIINLFKVPFGVGLGIIGPASIPVSLKLAPFAVVGALSGRWLIRYIRQELFENLALGLTLLAAARLLLA